jgi:hypothetical protein
LTNGLLVENSVGGFSTLTEGGALYVAGGIATFTNITLDTNFAESNFGGLNAGGALYVAAGSVTIQNCAFEADVAYGINGGAGIGGAIYVAGGSVSLSKNTTFAFNFASTSNPDIFGAYTIG